MAKTSGRQASVSISADCRIAANGRTLFTSGNGVPFDGSIDLQVFWVETREPVGTLIHQGQDSTGQERITAGVYEAALYDDVRQRQTYGGILPRTVILRVDGHVEVGSNQCLWEHQSSRELAISLVSFISTAHIA